MSPAQFPKPSPDAAPVWSDAQREIDFKTWLSALAPTQHLQVNSLRSASADASFRRYFRIDSKQGSRIIMDAPPNQEDCRVFVKVAQLMAQAQLNVPQVLARDATHGFLLLTDLWAQTMLQAIKRDDARANQNLYLQAIDALLAWQTASQPGVLPRELELFPDWYLERHRGVAVAGEVRRTLDIIFAQIIQSNLAWPSVYVHRDFMPRNLMISASSDRLGVLDFQDAVYGPITYDIA